MDFFTELVTMHFLHEACDEALEFGQNYLSEKATSLLQQPCCLIYMVHLVCMCRLNCLHFAKLKHNIAKLQEYHHYDSYSDDLPIVCLLRFIFLRI